MGFYNQGFNIKWSNDIDPDACATHKNWCDAVTVCSDIGKIDIESIPKSGVIIGGFPCQGFSLAGPRKINDERNGLYKFFVKLVDQNQPYVFVAENVKGLLTLGEGLIVETMIQDFADRGYNVFFNLVNAADYGVPQERWRVIMIGFRQDMGITKYTFPEPMGIKVTLREALKKIPAPSPEDICSDSFSSRYMSRNRKRGWDDVSYTIPAMGKQVALHPSSPDMVKIDRDHWEFGSGGESRRFSWQEAAAIQTFPANLKFEGNLTSIYRQIGNAVPVRLAQVVAIQVRKALEMSVPTMNCGSKKASQTTTGKAFEYACLNALRDRLSIMQEVIVDNDTTFTTAKQCFFSVDEKMRQAMILAAEAGVDFVIRHEPQLRYPLTDEALHLCIQPDSKGQEGDVRDIVCSRGDWSIGLSCKHDHEAVKHPRLSPTIDFGEEWLETPCSDEYFEDIKPVFNGLFEFIEQDSEWKEIEDLDKRCYRPMLEAVMNELEKIQIVNPKSAANLIHYMLGKNDFYKIIQETTNRRTKITPFNINNTLGKPSGQHKPESKIKTIKLPTRIVDMRVFRKRNLENWLEIICDNGWTVSMRIHNASKKVEMSFKLHVELTSSPHDMESYAETWNNPLD